MLRAIYATSTFIISAKSASSSKSGGNANVLASSPFTGRSAYRGAGGMQHRFERWGNMLFGRDCLNDRIEHIGKAPTLAFYWFR
jgi:hypothetical protein